MAAALHRRSYPMDALEPRCLLARPDPSPAENVYFRLPLSSDTSVHFYFDRDTTSAVRAWNGTTNSYNGHSGTDFSGGPRGRAIFAAADGVLVGRDDGWGDGAGPGNGNYIRINHGNDRSGSPIMTWYLHMNSGTPTTRAIGSVIAAGEQIGGVGTSGNSTGLHLHFHTSLAGVAFDPFKATGSTELSWWANQGTGSPSTTAQSKKLLVGDVAEVYDASLNVRSPNPTSSAIASKPIGSRGTILAGPTYEAFGGDLINGLWVWYRVQWTDGTVGWSAQNWLRKVQDTTPPVVTSTAFGFETSPHKVTMQFSENVAATIASGDFSFVNVANSQAVPFAFVYDSTTRQATLTYAGVLPDGRYRVTLPAGSVADAAGNLLAAPVVYNFHVLAGDATRDAIVNFNDLLALAANYNTSGKTFSHGNFDYDTDVDFSDLLILASRYNTSLPGSLGNVYAPPSLDTFDSDETPARVSTGVLR